MQDNWVKHTGCIPCSFVCDSCKYRRHRCGMGEPMWLYNRTDPYGNAELSYCENCFKNLNPPKPGDYAPIEVDRTTGTRKVKRYKTGFGCCNCYYYAYPCQENHEGEESTMTYDEFLKTASSRTSDPEIYADFLIDGNPRPLTATLI